MSRRRRQCGITQTLIRVFVRGHETRAAHPSSQPSIPLFSLLLSPNSPLLFAFAWQPYFSLTILPHCTWRPRSSSATFHPTLFPLRLSPLCLLFFSPPINPSSSYLNRCDLTSGIVIEATCALLFLHFDFFSLLSHHSFFLFFSFTAPGRVSSPLPLLCYVLTNTHTLTIPCQRYFYCLSKPVNASSSLAVSAPLLLHTAHTAL